MTLETHVSKYSYQSLSEYFLKYSGLQTLALLSLDSAHILIQQVFLNLHFHTHTLTYDCELHIGLLHYLRRFINILFQQYEADI